MPKVMSVDEIRNMIEIEGLGYFITDYASSNSIPEGKLRDAFVKAREAIGEFERLVG